MNSENTYIDIGHINGMLKLLKTGDIFKVNEVSIEFSNGEFHEVYNECYDYRHMCERWVRTGKTYIVNEINELARSRAVKQTSQTKNEGRLRSKANLIEEFKNRVDEITSAIDTINKHYNVELSKPMHISSSSVHEIDCYVDAYLQEWYKYHPSVTIK